MIRACLPWPPKDVSPNARGHWSKKARAVKAYRDACGWECVAQNVPKVEAQSVHYTMTFHRPSNRGPWPDDDNLVGSMKAGRDAVATHIGLDDRHWRLKGIVRGETRPGGSVIIEIEPVAAREAA